MSLFEGTDNALILHLHTPSGGQQRHRLAEGATLIVGQGQNCGLRLAGADIAPIHCVLKLNNGILTVQDWCSRTGTFVDGTRVTDETEIEAGVAVRIGDYSITAGPLGSEAESGIEEDAASPDEHATDVDNVAGPAAELAVALTRSHSTLDTEDDDAFDSDASAQVEAKRRPSTPSPPRAPSRTPRAPSPTWDEEACALLQEELELLQSELAQRDARIQELSEMLQAPAEAPRAADAGELDGLMARLEELLDELNRGDQRVRSLEELLRAAQEASQAEQEERRQIDKWVSDIEGRLAEREAERNAEREVLDRHLAALSAQRDDLLQQLDRATAAAPTPEIPRGILQKLQSQIDELQQQLHDEGEQRRRAEERAGAAESRLSPAAYQERIEAAIREERLKLAQERAALSRERVELARHVSDQPTDEHANRRREADARFHAFRETLRELHQKDATPAVRKTGLAARLSDIWRRLDGPTDTD